MFSEPPLSSVPSSIPPLLSPSTSPNVSTSVSPSSSTSHSRTSTITSASFLRTDASSSSSSSTNLNQHTNRQMKIGKYFLERTIGKGNFAVVKLATHRDTHQKVLNEYEIFDRTKTRSCLCLFRWRLKSSINHV